MKRLLQAILCILTFANLSFAADYVYVLTNSTYSQNDIQSAIETEFGAYAEVADWENIKSDFNNDSTALIQALKINEGQRAFVNNNEQSQPGDSSNYIISTASISPIYDVLSDNGLYLSSTSTDSNVLVQIDIDQARAIARKIMFTGTFSSLAKFSIIMDQLAADSEYANNNDIIFLHCLSQTARLIYADTDYDGSLLELMSSFGIEFNGDNFTCFPYDISVELDDNGNYYFPDYAPDLDALSIIASSAADDVQAIIDELNTITDSSQQPFAMYFFPAETGANRPVEVDYAEVLLFKSIMTAWKAFLTFESAYDLDCGDYQDLLARVYNGDVSFQYDILDQYPDFLKLLPTANNDTDGKALLAQSKSDFISSLQLFSDIFNYMENETDDQSDDLFFITNFIYLDDMTQAIQRVIDSLNNDTVLANNVIDTNYYSIFDDSNEFIGELSIDLILGNAPKESNLTIIIDDIVYYYQSTWTDIDTFNYYTAGYRCLYSYDPGTGEYEYYEYDLYYDSLSMNLYGQFSSDLSQITLGNISNWDLDYNSVFTAQLEETESDVLNIDLNPLFGGTARYPDPVSIRDILPLFDPVFNRPLAYTVGAGLIANGESPDFAATFGGILPDYTQDFWRGIGFFITDEFYMQAVTPDQLYQDDESDSFVWDWSDNHMIYSQDSFVDTEENNSENLIESIYLGADDEFYYVTVVLNDEYLDSEDFSYNCWLSFKDKLGKNIDGDLDIYISGESWLGNIDIWSEGYKYTSDTMINSYWWGDYYCKATSIDGVIIDIKFPMNQYDFDDVEDERILGKYFNCYLELNDHDHNISYELDIEDIIRIVGVGNENALIDISGSVEYNNWESGPIYVQLFSDLSDTERSTMASAVLINGPGSFTLTDIPQDFTGYIMAWTPGFNMDVEDVINDLEWRNDAGVCIEYDGQQSVQLVIPDDYNTLNNPVQITLDSYDSFEMPSSCWNDSDRLWCSFTTDDSGIYAIEYQYENYIELYDSNMNWIDSDYDNFDLLFAAKANSIYFLKAEPTHRSYLDEGLEINAFDLVVYRNGNMVENDLISNAISIGPDTQITGTFENVTGNNITRYCCNDSMDLWYTFTPATSGVYSVMKGEDGYGFTIASYKENINNPLKEAKYCDSSLLIDAQQDIEYLIRIAGYYEEGDFDFTVVNIDGNVPSNSTRANALAISTGQNITGTTVNATGNELRSTYNSVWYKFIPAVSGIYSIDFETEWNEDDFYITVTDNQGNTEFENSDDYGFETPYFFALAESIYYIEVESHYDSSDNFELSINYEDSGLANDHWLNAEVIDPFVPVSGSLTGATGSDLTDSTCDDSQDLWYKFTPLADGGCRFNNLTESSIRFSVFANMFSNFSNLPDTKIMEYTPCNGQTYFEVHKDTNYYIRISKSDYYYGDNDFEFMLYSASYDMPGDYSMDNTIDVVDLEVLTFGWMYDNEYDESYEGQFADINYDGVVNIKDFAYMAKNWAGVIQYYKPTVSDDFETGDMSAINWQHSGDFFWYATDQYAQQGTYSARSGEIIGGQSSVTEYSMDTTGYTTLSFDYKVDSENDYDFFRFYVDGNMVFEESGYKDWRSLEITLTDGNHTFTWEYIKDDYVSYGNDCVWIDNLIIQQ